MPPALPVYRQLRVFAFDPGTTARMETAVVNEVTLKIPWEDLQPGPLGEYIAVYDVDEKGQWLYDPVDLNDPAVLSQGGLPPSDSNPQFHQQMVYAVAMRTITMFEKALGRKAHWLQPPGIYQPQLLIFPHILDKANAYYDRNRIYFGVFEAGEKSAYQGMTIFSCLSQDTLTHELAHALLDGARGQLKGDTNLDVYAFHEGFCDIVTLLQHFSLPEVLRQQLGVTRGELAGNSLLGMIAPQFAEALGNKYGLREIFGKDDENGVWQPKVPDPKEYRSLKFPHDRGALLLGAVFEAMNKVYRTRVSDLRRIALDSGGLQPGADLHPDLLKRLADEAADTAQNVLEMCVRALDYIPAVDITFSDFLRAIITADFDLRPSDPINYRLAFVEAFRRYGIFSSEVRTLSLESLIWPQPQTAAGAALVQDFILKKLSDQYASWHLPEDRAELYALMQEKARLLEHDLKKRSTSIQGELGEIDLSKDFEVKFIWPAQQTGPDGESFSQWVIEIFQQLKVAKNTYRLAGSTLLVDAETGLVRYHIHKAADWLPSQDIGSSRNPTASKVASPTPASPPSLLTLAPPLQSSHRQRRLRVYASDPSLSIQMETARINQVTLSIPWEELWRVRLGELINLKDFASLPPEEFEILEQLPSIPVGEYLEVIDYDPASNSFYEQVDLHHTHILAQDGLPPSQSIPQFHQQMVYAVAMRTIRNFERALGRLALWSPAWGEATVKRGVHAGETRPQQVYTPRLRLYPHALREPNAFYSPEKKAVLFGYFQTQFHPQASPVTVFTCLSQDIITHELTHALLDGMHGRFVEPSNPDMLAFHEAFADLVALFQHFSLPEVLESQLAATRGDLASQNRLGELAQEFGSAIGSRGALRSAIGRVNPQTGEWHPLQPDPAAYLTEMEPHNRGALLVATVFDAFLTIYRTRIADLLRIATRGSGILPLGSLHPDLVHRLAREAAFSAQTVLEMCIRALDYLPPVDITFGDYLRAILTADYEFDKVDEGHHRIAFIEAFKRHGILPENVRTYSLEGLLWEQARGFTDDDQVLIIDFIKGWLKQTKSWNISRDRRELYDMMRLQRLKLHSHLEKRRKQGALGFIDPQYRFEVHSLRPAQRIDDQGRGHFQWIIEITQSIPELAGPAEGAYSFRGGVTLLVDGESGQVRYGIYKYLNDEARRKRQRQFMTEIRNQSLYATYFQDAPGQEPFAVLHRF
jgi:hypothetical protein